MNLISECFASEKLIYVPARCNIKAKWVHPIDCFMGGQVDFLHKAPLDRLYAEQFTQLYDQDQSTLKALFSKTIGIKEWAREDIINELSFLKASYVDVVKIRALYTYLQTSIAALDAKKAGTSKQTYAWYRDQFTEHKLIFGGGADDTLAQGSGSATWYTPTQCIWTTSDTRIPGMLTLNNLYPDLHDFFVKGLGIQPMSAKMVYDKLMGPALTVEETKQTVETFNALLGSGLVGTTEDMDAAKLLSKSIFPVRVPNSNGTSSVRLCSGKADFVLLDRQFLADAFAGKANLLDFDLEGTRRLQPFLAWAGLLNQGLSKKVEEKTCVAGSDQRPIASRDRSIQHKARALLSVALAYNSPRCQADRGASLYRLLRSAETLEADKITSELTLRQGISTVRVQQPAATFHLAETGTKIVIYVPRNKRGQELCFSATLPQRLCAWLMTNPTTKVREYVSREMVYAVQSVLRAMNFAMADILDHNGIRFVNVPAGEEPDDSEPESEEEEGQEDEEEDVSDNTPGSDRQDNSLGSGVRGEELSITALLARSSISGTPRSALIPPSLTHTPPATRSPLSPPHTSNSRPSLSSAGRHIPQPIFSFAGTGSADDTISKGYSSLLDSVVKAARETALPRESSSGMHIIPAGNPFEANPGNQWLRSVAGHDRHKQIGAAGELFVSKRCPHPLF